MNNLTELEKFQLEDQAFCQQLQKNRQRKELEEKKIARYKESETHFDTVFINTLREKTSLTFEQFCIVISIAWIKPCNFCLQRHTRIRATTGSTKSDIASEYCNHLVCSEWQFLPFLRSISRVFWNRFLQTRMGQDISLCFPQCGACDPPGLMTMGVTLKQHNAHIQRIHKLCGGQLMLTPNAHTTNCLCRSDKAIEFITNWCKQTGNFRVFVSTCWCETGTTRLYTLPPTNNSQLVFSDTFGKN